MEEEALLVVDGLNCQLVLKILCSRVDKGVTGTMCHIRMALLLRQH